MAGSKSGGFAVSISAVDTASPTLDKINKRLAALSAPAEKFGKSVAKFGDVSGINRMAEGVQILGARSADAFRSLDRLAPALAGITSAASLAGMATLVQRWTQLGQQTQLAGQKLGVPTDRLTALRGAARLAGSSAEELDAGLGSLDEKLRSATFRGDAGAIQAFNTLHVGFKNADGSARNAADALGDVAEGIKNLKDHGAQLHAAQLLGMEPLLPLLKQGRAGIQALSAEAAKLGVVIPPAAAERAHELNHSFTALGMAIEAVENRLGDKWGTAVKPYIDGTTDWISKNKSVADSYAEIGAGILALGAIKPALWLARLLGITTAVGVGSRLLPYLAPLSLTGDTDPNASPDGVKEGFKPDNGPDAKPWGGRAQTFGQAWSDWAPTWLGGGPNKIVPPSSADRKAVLEQSRAFFLSKGLTDKQTAGELVNEGAESDFDPNAVGKGGDSFLFQWTGARKADIIKKYGPHPSVQQQLDYAWWEQTEGPYGAVGARLRMAGSSQEAASILTKGYEVPANPDMRAAERAAAAPAFEMNGHVQVDVNLKGAHPGTTAQVTTRGPVTASPPQVEQAMAH